MQTWIALLRGINVGGNNILPMTALRELLVDLGYCRVRTYIQSGNCVFECDGQDAMGLSKAIADGIQEAFGFRSQVLVLTKEDIKAAIAGNPYPEGLDNPKSVHLYYLSKPAEDADLSVLEQIQAPTEKFALVGEVFYLHAPEGIGRSKLAAKVEAHLGVPVTARNLRSVLKIAELAE